MGGGGYVGFLFPKEFFQQVAQRRFVFIRRTKDMPTRETKILVLFWE